MDVHANDDSRLFVGSDKTNEERVWIHQHIDYCFSEILASLVTLTDGATAVTVMATSEELANLSAGIAIKWAGERLWDDIMDVHKKVIALKSEIISISPDLSEAAETNRELRRSGDS